MARVENHPCCPHCHYDLRGLFGNTCPECGQTFDLNALHNLPRGSSKEVVAACSRLLFGSAIILTLADASPWIGTLQTYGGCCRPPMDCELLQFAGILGLIYAPQCWFTSAARWWRAASLIPPTVLIVNAVPIVLETQGRFESAALMNIIIGALAFAPALFRSPRMALLALSGLALLGPALYALRMVVDSVVGITAREHWSRWPDPRGGQIYDQYPLTNHEALIMGISVLSLSLPLAALWVWLASRGLRRK